MRVRHIAHGAQTHPVGVVINGRMAKIPAPNFSVQVASSYDAHNAIQGTINIIFPVAPKLSD